MYSIKIFLILLFFSSLSCNNLRPLCQFSQNKNQYLEAGLLMGGISAIVTGAVECMKLCILCGAPSNADKVIVRKDIFKRSCMMLAVGVTATITSFLMLGCNVKNNMVKL